MLTETTVKERTLQLLPEEFRKLLAAKTGWGRNEVMQAFETAMRNAEIAALSERLEK